MTVQISNTTLSSSFNTWRLNTNYMATVLSNNVITVSRAGDANRGGSATGNGHVIGTFSATELRTTTLNGGNTTSAGPLNIESNTIVDATTVQITANTTISGFVVIDSTGSETLTLPDISRVRLTGGSVGQYLRKGASETLDFESLTLRQITDLSSNSSHLYLSGANTNFSPDLNSPHLVFTGGFGNSDDIRVYLAGAALGGDSDLHIQLADADGDSNFVIADSSNNIVATISSDGFIFAQGIQSNGSIVPTSDDTFDLGSSSNRFRNAYVDGIGYIDELSLGTAAGQGVSTNIVPKTAHIRHLGTALRPWRDIHSSGTIQANNVNIRGTLSANGNLTLGNANTDVLTVTSRVGSDFIPSTNNSYDLGSPEHRWKDLYLSGTTLYLGNVVFTDSGSVFNVDNDLDVSYSATINENLTVSGNTNLGSSSTDNVKFVSRVNSNIIPNSNDGTGQYILGTNTQRWHGMYANNLFANNITTDNDITVGGDLTVTGNVNFTSGVVNAPASTFAELTVTGTSTLNGSIDLGDSSADVVSVNAVVDTNIVPQTGVSKSLGSSASRWNNVYANTLNAYQITNGSTTLFGRNSKLHANNTITNGTIRNAMLDSTGVGSGQYGSASLIPIINVNSQGRITSLTTTSVAGVTSIDYTQSNNVISVNTADGGLFRAPIDAATTTSGTGRGLASFDSSAFTVTNGHVSLAGGSGGAVLSIAGTAKEVNVSRVDGAVTVGLPDDVTVAGQLTVGENVVVAGNLIVQGTTTTVNTETVNIADNIVVLNSNYSGSTPSENGGIEIERGSLSNKSLIWNESTDKWSVGTDTFVAGTFEGNLTGNVTGNVTGNAGTATKLATARSIGISLSGDVVGSGSASFDGSGNITISATNMTVQENSVALGTDTTGNYVGTVTAGTGLSSTGAASGEGIAHTISLNHLGIQSLTDPNADRILFWDDSLGTTGWLSAWTDLIIAGTTIRVDSDTANTPNKIVKRNASGNFFANTITAALNGNAATASKWQTTRTLTLSGAVTGSASFDGSGNISINTSTGFTVGEALLETNAVTNTKIADNAVTQAKLANNAVTQAKLADDAVGSAELKDVVSLSILNSSGVALKTIYGAGS